MKILEFALLATGSPTVAEARVHTMHDPVRWTLDAIGNHALNGIDPPVHSWI